ncbi:MAG TPA: DUF11 domain-containing protein [Candidatus Limnocylindria bacterium]|nr:DUF11 domain-containing protein [Candidatus Limnocylindria bacterium]
MFARKSLPIRRLRRALLGGAILAVAVAFGPWLSPGAALEVPPVGGFYIQTSGPNAGVGIGDWYSSTTAGAGSGYNYLEITIPCGWPSATPLHFDLFSPEMNQVAGALGLGDEVRGGVYDSTQFELYGPGVSVGPGYALPAPGAGIPGSQVTYPTVATPETWVRYRTMSPVVCGRYLLRSAVLAPQGDDDNGWRLRVGLDDDGNATTAPPANTDNPDGVPGTNDEVVIGQVQITYQQDSGGVSCLTLYEYIPPGLASVTFHNFDMDGNTRVVYYAPSDAYDPNGLTGGTAGTLSINAQWNQGTIARGGDVVANPEAGWWRVVSCLSSTNQFIQEAQAGAGAYFVQPPIPTLVIAKTDGQTETMPGATLTYAISVLNTATGPTAGAAHSVVVTDALPAEATFVGCTIVAPATGSCSASAGVVTATLNGWINAGATAEVQVTVTVNGTASGTLSDVAGATYRDGLGNPFPGVTASDVNTVNPLPPTPPPDLPNTSAAQPGTLDPVRAAWLGLGLAALLVAVLLPLEGTFRRPRVF